MRTTMTTMTTLQIGQPAPRFIAQSTSGPVELTQCQDQAVVLYFYPKDHTPGCTTESQNFRDLYPDFQAARCLVFGVSRDSLTSHESFRAKQDLPFPLISDADEALCGLFDVIKMKNLYGKQVRGKRRNTDDDMTFSPSENVSDNVRFVPLHANAVIAFVTPQCNIG